MRHCLLAVVLLLVPGALYAQDVAENPTKSGDTPTSQPTAPVSEEALLATADEIAQKVAMIRGLAVKAPVKKGVKKREELRAVLIEKLGEEITDADIDAEAAVFKRLGVIPADLDYKKVLLDVLTEQIAGFYDQKTDELYIMQGIPLAMQRPAMAHELFHAIQDQHFDIESLQEPFKTTENSDFALARSALLEGDATVLMFDFEMYEGGQLPQGDATSLVDIPMMANVLVQLDFDSVMATSAIAGGFGGAGVDAADSALAKAPKIFRESLVFPYFAGMRFIVMSRNQRTWKDVDQIYERPPVSTEQILHPERYFAGDDPEWLAFDAAPALQGWKKVYDSVLGEFQLLQYLKAHPNDGVDPAGAAMGWDGDRIFAFQRGEAGAKETALIFVSAWDGIGEAQEFFDAAVKISKQRYPKATVEGADGKFGQSVCLVLAGERLYIEQWGDLVLYVEGTPSRLDADGKELERSTYQVRERVWKSLARRPLRDVIAERKAQPAPSP